MSNSPPPPKANNDVIVITRLNTVGLKRLAEGTLVEKSLESRPPAPPTRASSKPPEPARLGPSSMPPGLKSEPAMPKPVRDMQSSAEILDVGDLLGPDAEDKTLGLGADAAEDRTIAVKTTPPPQMAPFMASIERVASDRDRTAVAPVDRTKIAAARAEPALVVDPRLEMETPTALFVKDIQATLKEELAKQQREAAKAATPVPPQPAIFQLPPLEIAPISESAGLAKRDTGRVDKSAPLPNKNARPIGVARASQSVPPPPTSKPASLAPPAAKSTSSLPAPLHAQANRRKDPSGMSVSTRPARIERKGGFFPWAAALTALGVFVGVAGARVATGGSLGGMHPAPGAAQAIAHASEPGFAPKVVVPTEEAKPAEVAKAPEPPAPEPTKVEAKVEPKPTAPVAAEVATTKAPAKEPVAEKVEAKEEKVERVWERPRPRRAAPPVERAPEKTEKVAEKPEPKPEPVAAKARPAEKPAEKTEPAPKPPTKSTDVSAAARDYAAVESQLGQSL